MSLIYSDIASQWQPVSRSGFRFLAFSSVMIIVSLVIAFLLSAVEVPKKERTLSTVVPERIAQYVKNRKKSLPKSAPIETSPQVIKPAVRKIKKQRKKVEKPLSIAEKNARKRVASTGLLALSGELAALSDAADFSGLQETLGANNLKEIPARRKPIFQESLEDGGNTTPSISEEELKGVDVSTGIQRRETASLKGSAVLLKAQYQNGSTGNVSSAAVALSLEEELGLVFEKNKSRLYSIYERARRKNPGLAGKVLLELSIDVTGKVLDVVIVSSSLNDASLEKRIVARVRQFVFASQGRSGVSKLRYPIEFLPG